MEDVQPVDGLEPAPATLSTKQQLPKFSLGHLVATPGALKLLERTGFSPLALLQRHVSGDWGDAGREDATANEDALKSGARIMSVYRLVPAEWLRLVPRPERNALPTVWIITEAASENGERLCTTILRPEDY